MNIEFLSQWIYIYIYMKLIYLNFLLEFNILASLYLNYLKLCLAHLITQYFFIMPNPFSIYEIKN